MASFNEVTLIGRLTADPEIKETKNGDQFAKITIVTNRKNGSTDVAQFHDCVIWSKGLVEKVLPYAEKGTIVHAKGRLEYTSYGERKKIPQIMIDGWGGHLLLLNTPAKKDGLGSHQEPEQVEEDEIPF